MGHRLNMRPNQLRTSTNAVRPAPAPKLDEDVSVHTSEVRASDVIVDHAF
jgi:hypothetical protein